MREDKTEAGRAWALLVTGGTVIEYPPELYLDRERATDEAQRWAWILSGAGWADIDQPFPGRWEVGERSVRLAEAPLEADVRPEASWIGTFWTRDGSPDPEALILPGREEALRWVREPPLGSHPSLWVEERPWFVAATYHRGDEEAYAVAHRAKLVT